MKVGEEESRLVVLFSCSVDLFRELGRLLLCTFLSRGSYLPCPSAASIIGVFTY